MRPLTRLVPLALLLLAGCAGPLPQPDPQMAWVELRSAPANTLLAERLDGERLSDGRYFQVTPGRHVLEVRFQYELYGGFGGGGGGFEAGRRYRLEVRPQLRRALALLSDERGEVVARSNFQTSRCPPY
ncbi:PA0061/PA0062 family lipoprotein [Pseudomonas aeruginosa]|uniref:PA0061/PA0062 family lipoprotein n=1 Tax=Pseudomonas aeruginosa TaxID=287 RepID=UPI000BBD451F|nr:hypothetical protein [Pseudomonas aeruginosa]PCK63482.1 hypothetical protein A2J11_26100 [Pseudomonas aeruginosa]